MRTQHIRHDLHGQLGGRGEDHGPQALLRAQALHDGQQIRQGLARAAGAERDDVLPALDPFATGQIQNLHLVELRDGGKVEAVEAFDDREPGRLDPALDLAAVPLDHLPLGKPGQVSDMVDTLGGA